MDETQGWVTRVRVFLRRGLPSLMELKGSLQVELALATCDWRELAVSAARVFYFRVGRWGWGAVYVLKEEDQM